MESKLINSNFLYALEKRAKYKLIKRYDKPLSYHDVKIINDILFNEKTHFVEMFKEYLLYEDYNEFLKKYYDKHITRNKLKNILIFYEKYSKIYANYTVFPESKYMYKNIKRKQKVIDQINNCNNTDYEFDYSINDYYDRTIFTIDVMNLIYDKSVTNKTDKSLNITKSSQNKSLNIFIDKMNNIEKQVINDKAKKCLSEKTKKNYHKYFRSKNDMNSPYNKKNIKSKDKNKLKNTKNFLENNKKNNNMNMKILGKKSYNNSNNYEINNNSNNIIIYNYNYNMNDNANNLNNYVNNSMLKNNNSLNINNTNINLISNGNKEQKNLSKKNYHSKTSKQKIISALIRHNNDIKILHKLTNNSNRSNNTNYMNYLNNKENKYKANLVDTIFKKCKILLSNNNHLNTSKKMNHKFFSSPSSLKNIFKNNIKKLSSKPLNAKNNISKYFISSNYNNNTSKNKITKKQRDKHYNNNILLKYSKIMSKSTKNKKSNKKENYSKEKANKNLKRPESHRNYHHHHSKIFSMNETKKNNKIINVHNNSVKKNIGVGEKNIFLNDYFFKDKNNANNKNANIVYANDIVKPYIENSSLITSNLISPVNHSKNSPMNWSIKSLNLNKNSFYSITNNNLSNSKINSKRKKKKSVNTNDRNKYDLLNKKIFDKEILILSERQKNNNKYKNYFFKNKTEKQLFNKNTDTKSYIIENNLKNKIINQNNSFSRIIINKSTINTPIKNKFNNKVKIRSKEKNNKIFNFKNSNNNYNIFNKIKQPKEVIIKSYNNIISFNNIINNQNKKMLKYSERNSNKKTIFKK